MGEEVEIDKAMKTQIGMGMTHDSGTILYRVSGVLGPVHMPPENQLYASLVTPLCYKPSIRACC